MSRARRRNAFKLLVAGLTLALGLLVTEVVLRVKERPERTRSDTDSWHVFDPELGWRAKPGWAGEGHLPPVGDQPPAAFPVRINAQGLRHDHDVAAVASSGVTRITAIGDSFTFGFGVPVGAGLVDQLDAALGPQVEVLNLGTCAWGIGQMRLALDAQALPLEPDLILITVMYQNFRRAVRTISYTGQHKPRFVLDGDGVRLVNTPLPAPTAEGPAFTDMPPEGGSFLLWKLGELADRVRVGIGGDAQDPRWRLGSALLRDAARAAEAAGVPLVVVLYPTTKMFDDGDPYQALLADEAGLLVCDLTPGFRAAGATAAEHFLSDGHPSAAGHALAARELAAWLRERGLVATE